MGDRLRMTVSTGKREYCLAYADRELGVLIGLHGASEWFPEGERFVTATGVYDNFTVAGGQNTTAWLTKPRSRVLRAGVAVLRAAERERDMLRKRKVGWADKLPPLVRFLKSSRAKNVRIRHHYAWN